MTGQKQTTTAEDAINTLLEHGLADGLPRDTWSLGNSDPSAGGFAFMETARQRGGTFAADLGGAFGPKILKEIMHRHRWLAIVLGFLGAVLIIRPGVAVLDPRLFDPFAIGSLLITLAGAPATALFAETSIRLPFLAVGRSLFAHRTGRGLLVGALFSALTYLFFCDYPAPDHIGLAMALFFVLGCGADALAQGERRRR